MGHGGEIITVGSPQHHHSSNHHPQVGGPNTKKPHSILTKVSGTGGGICHSHDSPRGGHFPSSSKAGRKSHSHSTPQTHSKPITMANKARQGKTEYMSSSHGHNHVNLVALQHFQQQQAQFHLLQLQQQQQQSFTAYSKGQVHNAVAPRQKLYSPPTLHPMPSKESNGSAVLPEGKEHFYAGARFETHPSHIGLPVPPSHWTAPLQRSQSQPSSPVPTSLPQKGVSVDLAALFGNSDSLKSASFPGERLMEALVKDYDKKMKQVPRNSARSEGLPTGSLAQAQEAKDETNELKKALGLGPIVSPVKAGVVLMKTGGCISNGSEGSPAKYQDISDQLKNLLKVAA